MRNTKIASVVVTYNRKRLLLDCLHALTGQSYPLDAIFIVDNGSTDDTPTFLKQHDVLAATPDGLTDTWIHHCSIDTGTTGKGKVDIYYVRLSTNRGGSFGFYEGLHRARELNFDWIWIMDDDSRPHEDSLSKMAAYFDRPNIAAIVGAVRYPDGPIDLKHRGMIRYKHIFPRLQSPLPERKYHAEETIPIEAASFVGLLVNRQSIDLAGYPDPKFFLGHDDIEYCMRLAVCGKILLVPDSVIYHAEEVKKNYKRVIFFGKRFYRPPYEKLWLKYYSFRNLIWLGKRYIKPRLRFHIEALFYYLIHVFLILLFDDRKMRRIRFYTSSFQDGLNGIFDNEKPEKILYG